MGFDAEIIKNAYRLGQFVNAPKNRGAILQRKNELLDKAVTFDFASLNILTQSAIVRLLCNAVKYHTDAELQDAFQLCIAFGYMLGKE